MKFILVLLLGFSLKANGPLWLTDFTTAKQEARTSSKFILLNFSGSDWCTPCIRMHKTLFESADFESFAEKELVLVNADFPRLNKHQLSKTQQKQNDDLAEQYNPSGKFPYTLLINNEGKVVKAWDGCPNESPDKFVEEINSTIHDNK
jgi:thioredoxin-related protein